MTGAEAAQAAPEAELGQLRGDPEEASLEAYIARTLPDYLRPGAPVPASWTGSPDAWSRLVDGARAHREAELADRFLFMVAVQGHEPSELGSGELQAGTMVKPGGELVRHEAAYDGHTMTRARGLIYAIAAASASLDGVLAGDLESISVGRQVGSQERVDVVLAAAETAVKAAQGVAAAQVAVVAGMTTLRVHRPFSAMGKAYHPGSFQIGKPEVDKLLLWGERMTAQAKQHAWKAPSGFTPESWPPFALQRAAAEPR